MTTKQAIALTLFRPALLSAGMVGILTFGLTGNAVAAVMASVIMLACPLAQYIHIVKLDAQARVEMHRLAEGDDSGIFPSSFFSGVIGEALRLLNEAAIHRKDFTQRRIEMEARVQVTRQKLEQFRQILEIFPQAVVLVDSQNHLEFANSTARTLLGLKGEKPTLEGQAELSAFLEETRTRHEATAHRKTEIEFSCTGERTCYRVDASNLLREDGSVAGVVAVLDNVQQEKQVKTRHAQFVSSVCHELKTPMAGVKAYIEMLKDGDVEDPEEQQELYGYIETQLDRLTRLVNDMLNLTRIDSGVIKLHRVDCELNDVLRRGFMLIEPHAEEKNITLNSQLSEMYLPVHIDRDVFNQAILNLLSNAVKYTPKDGEVTLSSRMEDRYAVIEVRDSGMGIPESSLPRLFERFYRVPENSKAAPGTGLGLSLVKDIVTELHNGQVEVESTVGVGTVFRITIPLGHCAANRKQQETASCQTSGGRI